MRIAYTISGIYNSGGMENILIQKANYLADELGYDVTIITTDQNNRKTFFPISNKIKLLDLGINYFEAKSKKLWHLQKYFLRKKHEAKLKAHLKKEKYDIVISLMDFDFTFLYKINDGSKKILEYHFAKYSKVNATNNKLIKLLQKFRVETWDRIVSKYDKFIVLTHEDRNNWRVKNIKVIPNFIKEIPNEHSKFNNCNVLSVGRSDFQKGFDMLIEAWKMVHADFPEWNLLIIGGGDKTELQKQIRKLNISDNVKLLPPKPNIKNEYLNSSLYVLSSRFEGLPLVLIEAMSYGLPIVSFSCPCGPKDVLQSEYSTLVERNNITELAESIKKWLNNKQLRMDAGVKAKQEAAKYSRDVIMSRWDNLFKSFFNQ